LQGNRKGRCLRRLGIGATKEWLLVPTFEEVFDIMYYTHDKLSHVRTLRKNKLSLNSVWYGIPEECLRIFLNTCPLCMSARNPSLSSRMQPLKFIMSPTVGHHAQVDLISMESMSIQGYKYILRYVDHLSGFSHVAIMRSKKGEEAGAKLIQIFSTAIIPEILQSDNGTEILGGCIATIKEYYSSIHLIKGRPRKPNSQGKVERGHARFKEALQKWMAKKGRKNWLVGAFVVNKEINDVPLENCGNFSPYNLTYKKEISNKDVANFGEVRHRHCKTEYGQMAAHLFCEKTHRINKDRLLSEEEIAQVMRIGDQLYEAEAAGNVDEQYTIDEWINMLVNEYLTMFNIAGEDTDLDFADDIIHDEDVLKNYTETVAMDKDMTDEPMSMKNNVMSDDNPENTTATNECDDATNSEHLETNSDNLAI
jgi:hypothetical protein